MNHLHSQNTTPMHTLLPMIHRNILKNSEFLTQSILHHHEPGVTIQPWPVPVQCLLPFIINTHVAPRTLDL